VSVGHSIHIRDEFTRSGVRTAHIDGGTPLSERDQILAQLGSGELEVVTNCMVLTEGWDMPEVGCCILARPTKKMGLYRQMIGRVLRPASGKTDAIVLDHSGAVFRHGFAEDHVEWTLDPERRAASPTHEFRCESPASRLLECSQCSAIRVGGRPCMVCGSCRASRRNMFAFKMANWGWSLAQGVLSHSPQTLPRGRIGMEC
jgi:DNA repair protein RadD